MPFRFVHTADIHLDSPLRSLALRNPELADLIGTATRLAFVNVIDLCLEEQVDALMIAGDLYDGDQTSMKTAGFLAAQIKRLDEAGIQTFIIRGNHDALSRITKELVLPHSVKVFGGCAEAITVERPTLGFQVAVHGISFRQPQAPESLLPKFGQPVDDAVNIALMHTSLAGAPGHDQYAPCKLPDLIDSGFDYWGLGHVHKREVHCDRPVVVMPGMPQGRDINEAGAKSVTLVTIGDDRTTHLEERFTSIAQFERVSVDVTGAEDWRDMVSVIETSLAAARDRATSEHLIARLSVTGATPLAWQIRRDSDVLHAEATSRASMIGSTWIETIEHDYRPQIGDTTSDAGNPVLELRELMADDVSKAEGFRAAATEIAQELQSQLPRECRHILGEDEASFRKILQQLIADGSEDVLARLHERRLDDAEAE